MLRIWFGQLLHPVCMYIWVLIEELTQQLIRLYRLLYPPRKRLPSTLEVKTEVNLQQLLGTIYAETPYKLGGIRGP